MCLRPLFDVLLCVHLNTPHGDIMSQSTTMTIRLEAELKARLDKLSETTHRSKSYLAAEAVREFIEINEWQIQEISAAIQEADAGDFASAGEADAIFTKWGVSGD